MICRDTLEYDEETPIPTREYILQNWRADVIALTTSTGDLLERVTYDPYGIPFATHPTDLTHSATSATVGYGTPNGVVNNDDYFYFLTLYGLSDWRADWNRDGVVDTDDHTAYFAEWLAATGSWGRGGLSNRGNILGYPGYVHEPATGAAGGGHGTMWHVRHRVLHSGVGRWIQRDPAKYIDGPNLYAYGRGNPVVMIDRLGMAACSAMEGAPPDIVWPHERDPMPFTPRRDLYPQRPTLPGRGCADAIDWCKANDPRVRAALDRINETLGCGGIPEDYLLRCAGEGEEEGCHNAKAYACLGPMPRARICPSATSLSNIDFCDVIMHELTHVEDACNGIIKINPEPSNCSLYDPDDCANVVCAEARAYTFMNTRCCTGLEGSLSFQCILELVEAHGAARSICRNGPKRQIHTALLGCWDSIVDDPRNTCILPR